MSGRSLRYYKGKVYRSTQDKDLGVEVPLSDIGDDDIVSYESDPRYGSRIDSILDTGRCEDFDENDPLDQFLRLFHEGKTDEALSLYNENQKAFKNMTFFSKTGYTHLIEFLISHVMYDRKGSRVIKTSGNVEAARCEILNKLIIEDKIGLHASSYGLPHATKTTPLYLALECGVTDIALALIVKGESIYEAHGNFDPGTNTRPDSPLAKVIGWARSGEIKWLEMLSKMLDSSEFDADKDFAGLDQLCERANSDIPKTASTREKIMLLFKDLINSIPQRVFDMAEPEPPKPISVEYPGKFEHEMPTKPRFPQSLSRARMKEYEAARDAFYDYKNKYNMAMIDYRAEQIRFDREQVEYEKARAEYDAAFDAFSREESLRDSWLSAIGYSTGVYVADKGGNYSDDDADLK